MQLPSFLYSNSYVCVLYSSSLLIIISLTPCEAILVANNDVNILKSFHREDVFVELYGTIAVGQNKMPTGILILFVDQ